MKYESVIIIKPNLSMSEVSKVVSKVENKIKEFTSTIKKKDLGIKKLAYEINKNKEGHYLAYYFELNTDNNAKAIKNIEYFYKITDEIMRYITVNC